MIHDTNVQFDSECNECWHLERENAELKEENSRLREVIKKFIFDWERYFSTTPVGQPPLLNDLKEVLKPKKS